MENSNKNKDNNNDSKKFWISSIILLVIIIALSIAAYLIYSSNGEEKDKLVLPYTELIQNINNNTVEKIELTTGSTTVKVKLKDEEEEKTTIVPSLQAFTEYIQTKTEQGNEMEVIQNKPNALLSIGDTIFTVLPTLLMIALIIMLFKMQGLGDKGKVYDSEEKDTNVRFEDVAGLDEEKEEMVEIVNFLKKPEEFYKMGAKVPRGVLLCGKPGTGKTLIAKAIAGEANVPFISMSGSEFIEMFAGLGASRVRKLFEKAKKIAPCIVFIDEIDAIGSRRTSNSGAESENNQTLNQLLVEMDGFSGNEGIIVLAATNRADVLDPALLRPGRFDRQIQVANPDKRARSQILKVHARNKRFTPDVNFDNIAQRTPGFSGAELSNVLNEAALLAVRQGHDLITMADIDEAVDRVMGGPAKKSRKYTEKERRLVAYHEAGHALIGLTLEDANKVQKVTIVPRGQAGGYNLMTPKEETYFQTKSQLKATISGYMGGRVAEEVFFGDVSSGAHNDIEQATRIARMMVTELGMSELGPIQYDSENGQVFLGRDYTQRSNTHSGQIAYEIDVQVRKIIDECYQEATNIVEQHKEKLICIAEALLEHETLSGEDIESLYNTGKMLEHHDGSLNQEPVQEVVEPTVEKPSIDDQDDLLDEMK